jgi:6-pyruvoyl-tetrahydropterin synthase
MNRDFDKGIKHFTKLTSEDCNCAVIHKHTWLIFVKINLLDYETNNYCEQVYVLLLERMRLNK